MEEQPSDQATLASILSRANWTQVVSAWVPPFLLLTLGLATIHAPATLTGFANAPGDIGDGRIMLFLLESNWRAVLGGQNFLSPPMFSPVQGTLAYTDAHLLWLPAYGATRILGLEPLHAFSAMFVILLSLGYFGCFVLLRAALGLSVGAAAVGAFLFAFSNALTQALNHGQLVGVIVLPWVLLLGYMAWRKRNVSLSMAAGLLIGLLAATSFVVAWFFLLFSGISVALGLVLFPDMRSRRTLVLGLAAAIGLAIGLIPFLAIYGDEMTAGRARDLAEINVYRPYGSDLLNLGIAHPVYGRLLGAFGIPADPQGPIVERRMGSSLPVWVLAAIGVAILLGRRDVAARALLLATGGAALGTLLEFRYAHHAWPWTAVFWMVPGASAIRTPFRSELVALLPLTALAAVSLDRVAVHALVGKRRVMAAIAFVLLASSAMLEAWGPTPYSLLQAEQARDLDGVPAPPTQCTVFGLAPSQGREPGWAQQSLALMLALHWGFPTMNGNSSWHPPGWNLMNPAQDDYPVALAHWITSNHLGRTACFYEPDRRRWLTPEEVAKLLESS